MMDSFEKLADIRALINEIYDDETDPHRLASRDCFRRYCDDIEKDLEALQMFKNAIIIKKDFSKNPLEFKEKEDGSISVIAKKIYEIEQNSLEEDVQKNLKEWVVKNFFSDEQKILEMVKTLPILISVDMSDKSGFYLDGGDRECAMVFLKINGKLYCIYETFKKDEVQDLLLFKNWLNKKGDN